MRSLGCHECIGFYGSQFGCRLTIERISHIVRYSGSISSNRWIEFADRESEPRMFRFNNSKFVGLTITIGWEAIPKPVTGPEDILLDVLRSIVHSRQDPLGAGQRGITCFPHMALAVPVWWEGHEIASLIHGVGSAGVVMILSARVGLDMRFVSYTWRWQCRRVSYGVPSPGWTTHPWTRVHVRKSCVPANNPPVGLSSPAVVAFGSAQASCELQLFICECRYCLKVDDHITQLCPYKYDVPKNAILGKGCSVVALSVDVGLVTHVVPNAAIPVDEQSSWIV
ncbi:unnamed protein product [Prunus armeniaca]